MNFKSIFAASACGILLLPGCKQQPAQPNTDLTVNLKSEDVNYMAYLVNYDTKEKFDSTIVGSDSVAHFSVFVDQPFIARLLVGDKRRGTFIVEPGTLVRDTEGNISGSELNDELQTLTNRIDELYSIASNDSLPVSVRDSATTVAKTVMENAVARQDIVGSTQLLDFCYEMTATEFDSVLTKYPYYRNFENVKRMAESKNAFAATAAGKKIADFSVGDNDSIQHFSDYVGKGRYTVVDFWASWCGPCRREMKNLKEIYAAYNGKGLDILGVAVWDKPEDSKKAIEQLGLPWQQILDAQEIPTKLYGIIGIPHIMVISPEGTILSRNLAGSDLRTFVDSVMTNPTFPVQAATTNGEHPAK